MVAIAAASRGGHPELFIFGLLLTIPLIIAGSQLVMALLTRFSNHGVGRRRAARLDRGRNGRGRRGVAAIYAGLRPELVKPDSDSPIGIKPASLPHYVASGIGAVFVVALGWILRSATGRRPHSPLASPSPSHARPWPGIARHGRVLRTTL